MCRIVNPIGECDVFSFLAALNYTQDDIAGLYLHKNMLTVYVKQEGREVYINIKQSEHETSGTRFIFFAAQQEEQIINAMTMKLYHSPVYAQSQYYREVLPFTKSFDKAFKALSKVLKAYAKANMQPSESLGYQFTR